MPVCTKKSRHCSGDGRLSTTIQPPARAGGACSCGASGLPEPRASAVAGGTTLTGGRSGVDAVASTRLPVLSPPRPAAKPRAAPPGRLPGQGSLLARPPLDPGASTAPTSCPCIGPPPQTGCPVRATPLPGTNSLWPGSSCSDDAAGPCEPAGTSAADAPVPDRAPAPPTATLSGCPVRVGQSVAEVRGAGAGCPVPLAAAPWTPPQPPLVSPTPPHPAIHQARATVPAKRPAGGARGGRRGGPRPAGGGPRAPSWGTEPGLRPAPPDPLGAKNGFWAKT